MLLSAIMCAKPLRHCNVNIKLYINQIYVNTIIHREFTFAKELNKIYLNNIIKKKLVERANVGRRSLIGRLYREAETVLKKLLILIKY